MSEIEAIVQAIHVLSRVSAVNIQDLVPYQTKLEDTLCILQRSLEAIRHQSSQVVDRSASSPLPNTPISSSDPPFPRNCARNSISQQSTSSVDEISNSISGGSENLGSEVRQLLQALADSKRSKKIVDYLSSASDPVNGSRDDWTQEDPRVVDIVLCSGTRSLDASFRRGLGQRSLAMEYEEWEEKTFKTSRVSELHRDSSAAEDHIGHINQFIEANSLRFKDKNTTSHGIKHGIRLLVFERTYGHAGVSAILILVYSRFRKVKYKHHFLLKQLIHRSPLWDSLARDKSSWLVQCQGRYDERIAIWQELQELRSSWQPTCEGQKRQRLIAGNLRSFRSPLNANSVLPTDILVNNGEQPHSHSAPNAGHSTMETTLRIEKDATAATYPPSERLASMDNVSLPQNLGHQSLAEESSTPPRLMDGVLSQALFPDQQDSTQRPDIAIGRFLEETNVPSSPNNQQLSHLNPSNASPTYAFNPLDYPSLLPGTQMPQDSQIHNVFNPLDYPSLVTDPQLPPESQIPTIFNPLDYPSLVPDPQIPESQISDVFGPNRIPSHQLHPVLQFLNVFNPLDYPSIPSDAQTCANIRQAENAQSDIPPTPSILMNSSGT